MADIGSARMAVTVELGGRTFAVLPQSIGRLSKIREQVKEIVGGLAETPDVASPDGVSTLVDRLVDAALTAPARILGLFIPELPGPEDELWTSETEGVTIPEIVTAFGQVAKVNRLDVLQGFFRSALPALTARAPR